jgi:protease I
MADTKNIKVAILVADGFEQIEMTSPRQAMQNDGITTELISPNAKVVRGFNHHDPGDSFMVDKPLDHARPEDYDALLLPGGVMNPDELRANKEVVAFVRAFFDAQKPVAAICHGPWTLIEAGVVEGRRLTSYHSIRTDLVNAGAQWVDEPVVVDSGLITSRSPDDLEAFNTKLIEEIHVSRHAGQHT